MAGTTVDARDPQTAPAGRPPQGAVGWVWRTREAMAPLWCATGALTCGAVAHALPDHWWGAVGPAAYGLTAAYRIDRDSTRGFIRTRAAKIFHGAVATAFGIWMVPAAAGGLDLALVEFVGAGVVALGGLWWLRSPLRRLRAWRRRRRAPAVADQPIAELTAAFEPAAPDVADQLIADWDEHVAANGRSLAGARLTDLEELRRGKDVYAIRATVLGVRGRHTTAGLLSMSENIRSGLDLHTGTILMDGTGTTGSAARLTVYLGNNPLRELRDLPRPEKPVPYGAGKPLTGTVGEFADGQTIRWVYYWPGDGAKHGIIAGDTGTGKGVATDKVIVGAVATGQIVVLMLDPKDGRSSSVLPLIEEGGIAVTEEERDLLLDGILAEHRRRNAALAVAPWTDEYGNRRNTVPGTDPPTFFTPTPDMPLILVIVEEVATQTATTPAPRAPRQPGEANTPPKPSFAQRLGTGIRETRASGIAFVAVGQGVGAPELGGTTNRSNLAQNLMMLRTKNPLTGQRLGDDDGAVSIKLDPASLFANWPGTNEPAKGLFVPAGLCGAGRAEPGRTYPNGDIVAIVKELLARPDRATLPREARATLGLDDIAAMRAGRLAGTHAEPDHTPRPPETAVAASAFDDDASTRDLIVAILREADASMAAHQIIRAMVERGRPVTPQNLGNHMARLMADGLVARPQRGTYEAVVEAELIGDYAITAF
jgi:hypothetical protein